MKRVTKKQSKDVRLFVYDILDDMRKTLHNKYIFNYRLVGSAQWNIIIKDKNGWWDLDFQLILTKNSKEYKNNEFSQPTTIKNDFFNYFNEKYKNDGNYTVENSTTAITLINNASKYSIDFVILRDTLGYYEIIRRNNKDDSRNNEYTWNELKKMNQAYSSFGQLSSGQKIDVINNHILPRKVLEKEKPDNDKTKLSSSEVFVVEVNNYVNSRKNNRLSRK